MVQTLTADSINKKIIKIVAPNERSIVTLQFMDKKEQILSATLELIVENGFHATPMSMISKHAKVAAGTIYHYFESKEVLIEALYAQMKEQMGKALAVDRHLEGTYQERFKKIWTGLFSYYRKNPLAFRFLEQYSNSPLIRSTTKEEQMKHYLPVVDFLQEGITSGDLKNVPIEIMTQMVYGTIVSAAKYCLNVPNLQENELAIMNAMAWDLAKN